MKVIPSLTRENLSPDLEKLKVVPDTSTPGGGPSVTVLTPNITNLINGETDVPLTPNIVISGIVLSSGEPAVGINTQLQISTSSNFDNIIFDTTETGIYSTSISIPKLDIDTLYFIRVRHKEVTYGWSSYSEVISFTTINIYLEEPEFVKPINGTTNMGLTGPVELKPMSVVNGSDTAKFVRVRVATDEAMSDIKFDSGEIAPSSSGNTTVNLTDLSLNTNYYIDAYYVGTTYGKSPVSQINVTTLNEYVLPPSITNLVNGETDVSATATFNISPIALFTGASATGTNTQFIIATDEDFANIVYNTWSNGPYTTSITIPANTLSINTKYYTRVRHNEKTYGWSNWSTSKSFTTENAIKPTNPIYIKASGNWVAPYSGEIEVTLVGGGAAGGGRSGVMAQAGGNGGNNGGVAGVIPKGAERNCGSTGGGAGGVAKFSITVIKGQAYPVVVGAKGLGVVGGPGQNGGSSGFNGDFRDGISLGGNGGNTTGTYGQNGGNGGTGTGNGGIIDTTVSYTYRGGTGGGGGYVADGLSPGAKGGASPYTIGGDLRYGGDGNGTTGGDSGNSVYTSSTILKGGLSNGEWAGGGACGPLTSSSSASSRAAFSGAGGGGYGAGGGAIGYGSFNNYSSIAGGNGSDGIVILKYL